MNNKIIFAMFFLVSVSFMFYSCSKQDRKTKSLSNKEGRWTIELANYQKYDSIGNLTFDTVYPSPGELIMFQTGSYNALFDYRQGVFLYNDTSGKLGYFFEYMFDGNRIDIRECQAPFGINGTYTSVVDKKNEQQWEIYFTKYYLTSPNSMGSKFILKLRRSKD